MSESFKVDNQCFHPESESHVLCDPGNLSIAIDKESGDIIITSRKEKYRPITKKENEKYIQIRLEKILNSV